MAAPSSSKRPRPSSAPGIYASSSSGTKPSKAKPSTAPKYKKRKTTKGTTKKKAKSMSLAAAHALMNPWTNRYPPADGSAGNTTFVTNRATVEASTTTTKHYLLYMPSAPHELKTIVWNEDGTRAFHAGFSHLKTPAPMTMRTVRAGIRGSVVTRADAVEGLIRVCTFTSPLDLQFTDVASAQVTTAFIAELESMLTNDPNARTYPAHVFCSPQTFLAPRATRSGALENKPFNPNGGFPAIIPSWLASQQSMSLGNVLISFGGSPSSQAINWEICEQNLLRFPQDHLISTLARPSSSGQENALQTAAQLMALQPSLPSARGSPYGGTNSFG